MTTTAAHHEDQMTTTRFATSADGTRIAYEVQDAVPDGRVDPARSDSHDQGEGHRTGRRRSPPVHLVPPM